MRRKASKIVHELDSMKLKKIENSVGLREGSVKQIQVAILRAVIPDYVHVVCHELVHLAQSQGASSL